MVSVEPGSAAVACARVRWNQGFAAGDVGGLSVKTCGACWRGLRQSEARVHETGVRVVELCIVLWFWPSKIRNDSLNGPESVGNNKKTLSCETWHVYCQCTSWSICAYCYEINAICHASMSRGTTPSAHQHAHNATAPSTSPPIHAWIPPIGIPVYAWGEGVNKLFFFLFSRS